VSLTLAYLYASYAWLLTAEGAVYGTAVVLAVPGVLRTAGAL
jgi:hypothetical protein